MKFGHFRRNFGQGILLKAGVLRRGNAELLAPRQRTYKTGPREERFYVSRAAVGGADIHEVRDEEERDALFEASGPLEAMGAWREVMGRGIEEDGAAAFESHAVKRAKLTEWLRQVQVVRDRVEASVDGMRSALIAARKRRKPVIQRLIAACREGAPESELQKIVAELDDEDDEELAINTARAAAGCFCCGTFNLGGRLRRCKEVHGRYVAQRVPGEEKPTEAKTSGKYAFID